MSKLTESARGQECLIRTPECNFNPETTVLCHLNGGGMGMKHSDLHGAFGCSSCHAVVDRAMHQRTYTAEEAELWHLKGVIRTQIWWMQHGLIDERGLVEED